MHNIERPLVVAISAIISNNKILLIRREKDGFEGMWSLPGGKVRTDEHVAQAAVREIKEETGLDVEFAGHLGYVSEHLIENGTIKHVVLHLCEATARSTETTQTEGELGWWNLETIDQIKYDLIPSDFMMITQMVKNRKKGYYESVIETIDGKHYLRKFE